MILTVRKPWSKQWAALRQILWNIWILHVLRVFPQKIHGPRSCCPVSIPSRSLKGMRYLSLRNLYTSQYNPSCYLPSQTWLALKMRQGRDVQRCRDRLRGNAMYCLEELKSELSKWARSEAKGIPPNKKKDQSVKGGRLFRTFTFGVGKEVKPESLLFQGWRGGSRGRPPMKPWDE